MWAIVALRIITFFLGPWLVIWALNTLFRLSIPVTLDTYFAVLILLLYLAPNE